MYLKCPKVSGHGPLPLKGGSELAAAGLILSSVADPTR